MTVMSISGRHSVPAMACLVNTYLTNCVMHSGLWKLSAGISTTYSILLVTYTLSSGKPVYDFLDFNQDPKAYFILGAINVVTVGGYLCLCRIDEWVKSELRSKRPYVLRKMEYVD